MEDLYQVSKSTLCKWRYGSSIILLIWHKEIMKECQYGCEIFIKDKLPRFTKKQRIPTDSAEFEMIKKKIDKVQSRRYIDGGTVLSLTALFYVPNREDDTRKVYDLTALRMNGDF